MSNRRKLRHKALLMGKPESSHNKVTTGGKLIDRPTGPANVVVLDLVDEDVEPPYCTHGKATCIGCDRWCWLGHETFRVVNSGEAYALCMPCAAKHLPEDATLVGHIDDGKRH